MASYLSSPLISPFFAIVNVFIGYTLFVYVVIRGLNAYNAQTFPIFSSQLFTGEGQLYNITKIVNKSFELDKTEYAKQGRINLSTFFAIAYGIGFAAIASTLTHVGLFYGR